MGGFSHMIKKVPEGFVLPKQERMPRARAERGETLRLGDFETRRAENLEALTLMMRALGGFSGTAHRGLEAADSGFFPSHSGFFRADSGLEGAHRGLGGADSGFFPAHPGLKAAHRGFFPAHRGLKGADGGLEAADAGFFRADRGVGGGEGGGSGVGDGEEGPSACKEAKYQTP